MGEIYQILMISSFNKQTGARLLKIAEGGRRFVFPPDIAAYKKEVAKLELGNEKIIWATDRPVYQSEFLSNRSLLEVGRGGPPNEAITLQRLNRAIWAEAIKPVPAMS
jgi:hypothetical protein